ncbi:MAG: sulfatase [Planctomycetota bacterium]
MIYPGHRRSRGRADLLLAGAVVLLGIARPALAQARPNVLLVVADDWSWPHASAYGAPEVRTPAFDALAAEGVLWTHAFAAAPSCTPSRAAILTGQQIWRLQQGANLAGTLPARHATFPELLAGAGYHVGFAGKGWGPGRVEPGGRAGNPAGPRYSDLGAFLDARPAGSPFCFWVGPSQPHRPYSVGSGIRAGLDPLAVPLPGSLPDHPEVRSDFADYLLAVQWLDARLGAALNLLEQRGAASDTLVIVTSDHGLPFPRGKANLYDTGTRVPLAVRWPGVVAAGRTVTDFVSLTDLAPTVLRAAGVPIPATMTGHALQPVLVSTASGRVDPGRDHVVTARERHAPAYVCQPYGYPMRALRTDAWLYVRNFEPSRRPAGVTTLSRSYTGLAYADVDEGPTKLVMLSNPIAPAVQPVFDLSFGLRPAEELYDLGADPGQLTNVAADPRFEAARAGLARQLQVELRRGGDPRATGEAVRFASYPFYGGPPVPTLTANPDVVSPAAGEGQALALAAGVQHAGRPYLLLGSMSGTTPGVAVHGLHLALNPDAYLALSAVQPNPLMIGSSGVLDVDGAARAMWLVPALSGPALSGLAGIELHHAYLVADATAGLVLFSNPCRLRLQP